MLTYTGDSDFTERDLTAVNAKLINDWKLKKMIGFGMDVNLGRHKIVVDCDFSTQMDENTNESEFGMKDNQIGVGYLVML